MLTRFFFDLRTAGVPVTVTEFLTLLEALQKDLAAQNALMAKAQIATQRARHLEDALKASAIAELEGAGPAQPAHGFADTQPLL